MAKLGLPWAGKLSDYPLTQEYGPTANTAEPSVYGYAHFHTGVDLGLPQGTPLIAPADGTVIVAGAASNTGRYETYGFGDNVLLIQHSGTLVTLYGHMSQLNVSVGQGVVKGQALGLSGGAQEGAGNSDGPHLHFEINDPWYGPKSPWPYLGDTGAASATGYNAGSGAVPTSGVVSYAQVIVWARAAGIPEGSLATAAAICMAESGRTIDATHVNADGSVDRGCWQVNSCHTQYDAAKLLSDGAYNAQAMADISSKGTNWGPWSTYTSGAYKAYVADATAALASTPPGTQIASSGTSVDPTTPQLPVNVVRVNPVKVNPSGLIEAANMEAVALLYIGTAFLPVTELEVHVTGYRAPGSFTAKTEMEWLLRQAGSTLLDTILQNSPTQITAYMGYIPNTAENYTPDQLVPVFTGLIDEPEFDHSGPQDDLNMAGADMSAVLSDPSATPKDLTQFQNMTSDQVVRKLVIAHNPKGVNGLSVQAAKTDTLAGTVFDNDSISTGQVGQTEMDIINTLAANEGYVAFFRGSTLYWGPLPAEQAPLILRYGFDDFGQPVSPVTSVKIQPKKHSKRDYQIVVSSYDQKTGQANSVTIGNTSSTTTMTFPQGANVGLNTLKKRAQALLQEYSATEVTVTVEIAGIIRLDAAQPIAFESDRIASHFTYPNARFYPVDTVYRYKQGEGFSMTVTATNRPWGLQANDSSQSGIF